MSQSENRSVLHSYPRPFAALVVVSAVALPVLIGFTMSDRRGWQLGLLSALIFAAVMVGGLLAPYRSWARRHPYIDGGALGPITLVLVLYLASWAVWVCLLIAAAGVAVGVLAGERRRRAWHRSDP